MDQSRGSRIGAIVAILAVCVAVTTVVAQPGEGVYPKTCNAPSCVENSSTIVWCEFNVQHGCCCKFTGQGSFTCQCVDQTTCLTSPDCRANIE